MPSTKILSSKDIHEIVAARGKESPASVRQRFGIGTTRLYRIWKDDAAAAAAASSEPEPSETEAVEQEPFETEPSEQEPFETEPFEIEPSETEPSDLVLHQILAEIHELHQKLDLLLGRWSGREQETEEEEEEEEETIQTYLGREDIRNKREKPFAKEVVNQLYDALVSIRAGNTSESIREKALSSLSALVWFGVLDMA